MGYYSVILDPADILVELTSTPRTGVHRYTFPENSNASVKLDLGAVIKTAEAGNIEEGYSIGGYFEVISDKEIIGRADFKGGWGHTFPYSVYFYLICDNSFSTYIEVKQKIKKGLRFRL